MSSEDKIMECTLESGHEDVWHAYEGSLGRAKWFNGADGFTQIQYYRNF